VEEKEQWEEWRGAMFVEGWYYVVLVVKIYNTAET